MPTKSMQTRRLSRFPEHIRKNLKLKPDALGYLSTVLRPHCQVDKKYGQIVLSPAPHLAMFGEGEGGFANRKGGGSPVQMITSTLMGQLHLNISYTHTLDGMR
jgi:hypothetical protein